MQWVLPLYDNEFSICVAAAVFHERYPHDYQTMYTANAANNNRRINTFYLQQSLNGDNHFSISSKYQKYSVYDHYDICKIFCGIGAEFGENELTC